VTARTLHACGGMGTARRTAGFQPVRRTLAGIASPACVRRALGGTAGTLHAFRRMGTTLRTAVIHAMGRTGSLGTLLHFPLHALAIMVHAHPFHIPSHALAVLFEFNPLQFKVKFFKLELKVHALDFHVHLLELILTIIVVVVVMAVSVVLVVMTIPIVMVSVMTATIVLVVMTTSVMVTFTSLAAQGHPFGLGFLLRELALLDGLLELGLQGVRFMPIMATLAVVFAIIR